MSLFRAYFVSAITPVIIILSSHIGTASAETANACLGRSFKQIQCFTQNGHFVLSGTQSLSIKAAKVSATLPVVKIKDMPARFTSMGITEESVIFVAKGSGLIAVIDIPCGQNTLGYVGLSNNTQTLPLEAVAQCQIE